MKYIGRCYIFFIISYDFFINLLFIIIYNDYSCSHKYDFSIAAFTRMSLKYCGFHQFWGYTIFGINKVNNIIIYVTQTLFKFII